MADTLDKRVQDLEYLLAHLPEDLDARFAGADSRMNARFDQLSIRLQAMERRQQQTDTAIANLSAKVDKIADQLAELLKRLPPKP